jgi:hypothetical protein
VITTTNGSTLLTAGATYFVQVNAAASAGYLAATGQAGSAVATLQLGTPTGVSGTTSGGTSLAVTWTNASNDPTGNNSYTIKACWDAGFTVNCSQTTITVGNSGTITGLSNGHSYFVEVMENAFTGYQASAWGVDSTADTA